MRTSKRLLGSLCFVLLAACSAAVEEEDASSVDENTDPIYADTVGLHRAAWNSNRTVIKMCWRPSAFRTDSKQALYTAGRRTVEAAIRQTWDANSWVDVRWASNCDNGGIPVEISDVRSNASPRQMTLNFDYVKFAPSCAPTGGTAVNATWTSCVRTIAVHEFGHVLGFDHEQNRGNPAGIRCAAAGGRSIQQVEDVGKFSFQGDLGIGAVAPASVMSYCPEGWRDTLHATDIEGVQSIFGGEGRHVVHGQNYALRRGDKFFGFSDAATLGMTERLDSAFRIERVKGAGSLAYGDKLRVRYGDKMLCTQLGVGTQFGTVPPKVVWAKGAYHPDACVWTAERVQGVVGGNVVDVNDPVYLSMSAPGGTSSDMHADIPFNDKIAVRFLGPFDPL